MFVDLFTARLSALPSIPWVSEMARAPSATSPAAVRLGSLETRRFTLVVARLTLINQSDLEESVCGATSTVSPATLEYPIVGEIGYRPSPAVSTARLVSVGNTRGRASEKVNKVSRNTQLAIRATRGGYTY